MAGWKLRAIIWTCMTGKDHTQNVNQDIIDFVLLREYKVVFRETKMHFIKGKIKYEYNLVDK